MAKQNKIQMPSGMGGLVRYFDDYKSKVEMSPGTVVAISIIIIILVLLVR